MLSKFCPNKKYFVSDRCYLRKKVIKIFFSPAVLHHCSKTAIFFLNCSHKIKEVKCLLIKNILPNLVDQDWLFEISTHKTE